MDDDTDEEGEAREGGDLGEDKELIRRGGDDTVDVSGGRFGPLPAANRPWRLSLPSPFWGAPLVLCRRRVWPPYFFVFGDGLCDMRTFCTRGYRGVIYA